MPRDALFDQFACDITQRRLRQLDVALARLLADLDPGAAPALLWLAALLSRQLADGHLCLDLAALAELADEQDWPPPWRRLLRGLNEQHGTAWRASPLLATGPDGDPLNAPLVLDGRRLYLRRYWSHEFQVAAAIRERLARSPPPPTQLADELARLFPHAGRSDIHRRAPRADGTENIAAAVPAAAAPDWPRIACALAARGAFTVITGGPGTGKTTTVVRLLGLLQTLQLREHTRPLRIHLAAPTGKAAARLNASIAAQLAELDVDDRVRAAIPSDVVTLHRLLGARPDTRRFRHDHRNPLHLDVLVIDEASMIDLEMMSAVLTALPASARLILLGDKDQLSSVEAGAVLGDICRRAEAGHYSADTADWLLETSGDDIHAFVRDDAQALDQQVTMLRHSHRFDQHSGIGRLAQAVNTGDTAGVRQLLAELPAELAWRASATPAQFSELVIDGGSSAWGNSPSRGEIEQTDHTPIGGAAGYRHYLEVLRRERPSLTANAVAHDRWAQQVLQAFNRFQLLCALRRGTHGVEGLNREIAGLLHTNGLIESSHGWYEGRPVMLNHNDYSLGLANGDVGICLRAPGADGRPRLSVAFLASASHGSPAGTRIRHVPPARLGDVTTVFAMTVHKSQGSEFSHAALVLPEQAGNVLTRELLYTGITRARERFSLIGQLASIELASRQRTRRYSGLADRLSGD